MREGYEVVFDSLRMVVKKKNLNCGKRIERGERLDDDGFLEEGEKGGKGNSRRRKD